MMKILGALALMAVPAIAAAQMDDAPTFVMKAGASDLYEKQSSKLVLASTTNPKLKMFARDMVRDHTTSTNEVKAAAMKAGVKAPPPMLEPMQASNIAALKAAHGADRDRLYIDQQKMAHQEALALHQGYAANGTAEPLKMAAAKIAPVVQHHIEMLQAM